MDKIGIIKKIDNLGRVTIPKSMRDMYSLSEKVEVIPLKEGVLVRNPEYELIKRETKENKWNVKTALP